NPARMGDQSGASRRARARRAFDLRVVRAIEGCRDGRGTLFWPSSHANGACRRDRTLDRAPQPYAAGIASLRPDYIEGSKPDDPRFSGAMQRRHVQSELSALRSKIAQGTI